jgi:hypothetical protein
MIGMLLFGCGATEDQLRSRAAFDMRCSESDLRVYTIDDRTKGVQGCGEQATYVESCGGSGCTWMLNTDDMTSDEPLAPPPRNTQPAPQGAPPEPSW